jgi:hypothetical protein
MNLPCLQAEVGKDQDCHTACAVDFEGFHMGLEDVHMDQVHHTESLALLLGLDIRRVDMGLERRTVRVGRHTHLAGLRLQQRGESLQELQGHLERWVRQKAGDLQLEDVGMFHLVLADHKGLGHLVLADHKEMGLLEPADRKEMGLLELKVELHLQAVD